MRAKSGDEPFSQGGPAFLERFRDGEHRALERVYHFFHPLLRNFILRGFAFQSEGRSMYFGGLTSNFEVDDIIQEAFRRAFGARARHTYDGKRPYRNYLFTIARNLIITEMSQRQRLVPVGDAISPERHQEPKTALEYWLAHQGPRRLDVEDEDTALKVEALEVFGIVLAFLENLSDDETRFFRIRFLNQISQEKTARRLGWSRAKVRKIESQLRASFVRYIQGSGYLSTHPDIDPDRQPSPVLEPMVKRARELWRQGSAPQNLDVLQVEAA